MGNLKNAHIPTDETKAEVRALATFIPQVAIAEYMGLDAKTLRKHYRKELDESQLKVHARVGNFLINAATGAALKHGTGATFRDCLTAAMFYGKTRMGLKEIAGIDHTTGGEKLHRPASELTDQELAAIAADATKSK